ncbi:hypothetical protein [Nocardia neocaledoniensis]|uniref:hypothetical protein n=1 Tax=Nocardia neocaledoniensis TaxID=236511 RepID=UPI0024557044|nr:hypothetical protein [Nocardia neocaledoniensis]
MIAMSHMWTQVNSDNGVTVRYIEVRPSSFDGEVLPATVLIGFYGGCAGLSLSIVDARLLAEQLPDILMSHDAAEHAAREQAAAVAESKAA